MSAPRIVPTGVLQGRRGPEGRKGDRGEAGPKGDAVVGPKGDRGLPGVNAVPAKAAVDAYAAELLDDPASAFRAKQTATFVRFTDVNGDPLPPGSVTEIRINTATGDIDDIIYQEA